jgi:hypothetical protein
MSMQSRLSRRSMLAGTAGAFGALLPVAGGCGKSDPVSCASEEGLAPPEKEQRASMAYVDVSPDRTRACEDCQQWVPAEEDGACGGCKVMKGPIHPKGSCKVFTRAS